MEAALAGLPPGSVNPEKQARAGEALAALRDQLTDLRAAEIVLCPKAGSLHVLRTWGARMWDLPFPRACSWTFNPCHHRLAPHCAVQ